MSNSENKQEIEKDETKFQGGSSAKIHEELTWRQSSERREGAV